MMIDAWSASCPRLAVRIDRSWCECRLVSSLLLVSVRISTRPDEISSPPDLNFVSSSANRHKEYRLEQEKKHEEWAARDRERERRLARGEEVGPREPDPDAEVEIGLWGLIKFLLSTIVVIVLTGKFVTGSYLWEYDGKWVQAKTYLPVRNVTP